MKKALVAVILAASLVTACGHENKLTGGEVYDHRYDDQDEWTTTWCSMPIYAQVNGYSTQIGCSYWSSEHHVDPPHWTLMVKGPDPDKPSKTLKEGHRVPEELWNEAQVGDQVDFTTMTVV